jgi:hypothetical protein
MKRPLIAADDRSLALARQMTVVRDVFVARGWEYLRAESRVAFAVVETRLARYLLGVLILDDGVFWCSCELQERVPSRNHRSIAQFCEFANLEAEFSARPVRMTFNADDSSVTLGHGFVMDGAELTPKTLNAAIEKTLAHADRHHDAVVDAIMEQAEFRDISPQLARIRTLLDQRRHTT